MKAGWLHAALGRALRDRSPRALAIDGFRAAAVLVPIVDRDGEPHLLLTERTADLPSHGGQISFPGGKLDEGDQGATACALREAAEEISLVGAEVEILGRLDDVHTARSAFVITPVVGWLAREPALAPNPREVSRAFYVPWEALRQPEAFPGLPGVIAFRWQDVVIWGATARIIEDLRETLR
jgi:8-oxo-dGTP pyrophosphatase MutT (NUDIX family)